MAVYNDRERFIPYQKFEIVDMIAKDIPECDDDFRKFCGILESVYHFKFHTKLEKLKQYYFPFNPDKDTKKSRAFSLSERKDYENNLVQCFIEVLNDANYRQIEQVELDEALVKESLFKISLYVDFSQFDNCILFWRGNFTKKITVRNWYFKKKEIEVETYRRIAMLIKFKEEYEFTKEQKKQIQFKPGSMMIKLFKNIPKADMEMLFPNTQVRMRLGDKLALGIPAFLGGLGVLFMKGTSIIYAIPILIAITYTYIKTGDFKGPGTTELAALIAAGTALGAIIGYGFRQWSKFRSRKIEFMKTLSENLYFKNLDNNVGVFHHLIDAAEEEECKEVILSYHFLRIHPIGLTEKQLDDMIEDWFSQNHGSHIDFEVDDALRKLKELGLCEQRGEGASAVYTALSLDKACERLDYLWDNYFTYNNK